MEMQTVADIVKLFGMALFTVTLFRRLMLPAIIGFLVAGIVAGPHVLGLIRDTHHVEQMAELGVILLLFTIGIEFSLKELARIKHAVFLGGGLQIALTALATAGIGLLFRFPFNQALFFGFLVALSSTAILMKLLMDAGEIDSPHGKTALGILIFQDLCIVPMMLFTPLLAGAGNGLRDVLAVSVKAAVVVVVAHYGSRFLVPWIFGQVVKTRSRELFLLTVIFISFGIAWITALVGLSLALGAFIAGLAISESEYSHQALGDIIPFRDLFMSLFFISVGMLLDPAVLLANPGQVIFLVLSVIILKTLLNSTAVLTLGIPLRVALITGISLAQIGEFSFVLSRVGLQNGFLSAETYQLFLVASIATMGLTPFLLKLAPPMANAVVSIAPAFLNRGKRVFANQGKEQAPEDHVIIAGFGVNGKNLARALEYLKTPYLVIESNPFTVEAERKRGERIIFGDAASPEILEHAEIRKARILVVAISDAAASRRIAVLARRMSASIHIIVRTRYVAEVEPLYRLGVNEVIPEEFETSVEILSRVLKKFLLPQDVIDSCIAEVRKGSYEMLRGMSRRHSHATGISGYLSGAEIGTFMVGHGSLLEGKSMREGTLRDRSGVTVLAIRRGDDTVTNPDPVWELRSGDIVLLLGTPEQLSAAGKLFRPTGSER
jgi:CPA2 family monovalent cation:H+ antiporter-2